MHARYTLRNPAKEFSQKHADVELHLLQADPENIFNLVEKGAAHIGMSTELHSKHGNLLLLPSAPIKRIAIMPKGHPTNEGSNAASMPDGKPTRSCKVSQRGRYAAKYKRDELFSILSPHHIPCAPVRDLAEVTNDPHLHEKGMLEWMNHPKYGRIAAARSPLRFGDHALPQLTPSAELGAHNHAVYSDWLGIPKEELEGLQKEGVI